MRRTSLLLIIGVLVLILVGGYTGYLMWQKSVVKADLARVDRALVQAEEKSLEFKDQAILESINAKEALPVLEAGSLKWSKVIRDILQTLPQSGGEDLVKILSYSGSANRDIAINVQTNPERDELYFDAADLIEEFDDSNLFTDIFVPSLTAGRDDEGREILTFVLSANYVEEDAGALLEEGLEEAVSEVLEESLDDEAVEEDSTPVLR